MPDTVTKLVVLDIRVAEIGKITVQGLLSHKSSQDPISTNVCMRLCLPVISTQRSINRRITVKVGLGIKHVPMSSYSQRGVEKTSNPPTLSQNLRTKNFNADSLWPLCSYYLQCNDFRCGWCLGFFRGIWQKGLFIFLYLKEKKKGKGELFENK
jgi:hypothetical protein